MGAELEQIHPDMQDECRDLTYDIIRTMKALCNEIRQQEW